MARVLRLAVGLLLALVSSAGAGPPARPALPDLSPAPKPAPAPPTAHAAQAAQPAQPAPPQESVQTMEDEPAEEDAEDAAEGTPRDVATFAESTMGARRLRFALNAFGDASLIESIPDDDGDDDDERSAFSLGTFALLINAQLGSSLLGTAEVAFDARRDNSQDIELERLHLRWQGEHFYAVGGRMHTDIGYWNPAFHHGAWLFLPVQRPRIVRGETGGGFLPIHWIGIEGGVILSIAPGVLTVAGGVGNGRGAAENVLQLRSDTNDFKALKLKVEYQGLGLPDLRVGAGGLYDRIAAEDETVRPALPDEEIDEIIGNVFAAYRGAQMTLIAEAYSIWHRGDDDTFTTTDVFVVAGYRVGRITPYVLVERIDDHGGTDPFYTSMPDPEMPPAAPPQDQTEAIGGVRVDVSVWSALKAEYGVLLPDDADGPDHTIMLNWSFGI